MMHRLRSENRDNIVVLKAFSRLTTKDASAILPYSSVKQRRHMSDTERDYKVGPGKPPLHTRFQKGQSGNPAGRPGFVFVFWSMQSRHAQTRGQGRESGILQGFLFVAFHVD